MSFLSVVRELNPVQPFNGLVLILSTMIWSSIILPLRYRSTPFVNYTPLNAVVAFFKLN